MKHMRIVIDLQACQSGSRQRGIGRYAMAITRAMIEAAGGRHTFYLVLTDRFPETVMGIRREFEALLPQAQIVVLSMPEDIASAVGVNVWRTRAAEVAYANAITALRPDVYFSPSLFEGFWEPAVTTIEPAAFASVTTLYDLIPLSEPDIYLGDDNVRRAYEAKLAKLHRADMVFAISDFSRNEAIRLLGMEPERIIHVPLGVSSKFHPVALTDAERSELLARYGIRNRFIINTSPLETRKNLLGLLAAFACIEPSVRQGIQLVIAGHMNAEGGRIVARAASEEGLAPDDVIMAGYVPDEDLAALYSCCEVMAFPSLSEGFGLPPLEAMACGAAVAVSNQTSIPEVIGRDEMLFDPRDPIDMARVISGVLTDPAYRDELRAYGLERAKTYSWDRSGQILLNAIEQIGPKLPIVEAKEGVPGALRRIGVVAATGPSGSRSAATLRDILRDLSTGYEVTLAMVAGDRPDDPSLKVIEQVDPQQLELGASRFDRIVYYADAALTHLISRAIAVRPGLVVVTESGFPNSRVSSKKGRSLAAADQADLHALAGFGGLLEALTDADQSQIIHRARGAALQCAKSVLLAEAGSSMAAVAAAPGVIPGAAPVVAVSVSASRRDMFRRELGIPQDARVVLSIANNEEDVSSILRSFRRSSLARSGENYLVVCCASQDPEKSTYARQGITPGRIVRFGSSFVERYIDLLSAADAVVLAGTLPVGFLHRLTLDASHASKRIMRLSGGGEEDRGQSSVDPTEMSGEAALSQALDSWAVGNYREPVLDASDPNAAVRRALLLQALVTAPRPDVTTGLERIPTSVHGVSPSSDDLALVAYSLAQNASLAREPALFLDVTAIAVAPARQRLDARTKRFLKDLLRAAGRKLTPVYFNNGVHVAANQFIGGMIGLPSTAIADEIVTLRSGDRLFALDAIGGLHVPRETLQTLAGRGVGTFNLAVDLLLVERPDLSSLLAEASLEMVEAIVPTADGRLYISDLADTSDPRPQAGALDDSTTPTSWVVPLGGALRAAYIHKRYDYRGPVSRCSTWGDNVQRLALAFESPPAEQEALEANYTVMGHVTGAYSLAIVNRNIASVLHGALPDRVAFEPFETVRIHGTDGVPAGEQALMSELIDRQLPSDGIDVIISHHYPVLPPPKPADLSLALFHWEETHVPAATVETLVTGFSGVLAPAASVRKALIDSGLAAPVSLVGLPAALDAFSPQSDRVRSVGTMKTFLHVSSCFPRKGIDVLLAAWARAFQNTDSVRLVIKTFPNPHNDVDERVQRLRAEHPDLAEIDIINTDVDHEALVTLYAAADVMVLPTRGEGFNLPALEAMAAGLPLIVTGHGGQMDFCSSDEARLLDYTFAPSGSHVRGGHSLWVEPSEDDLVEALREHINPAFAGAIEFRRLRAIEVARVSSDKRAWVQRVQATVASLSAQDSSPPQRLVWVTTWALQCGIAQYSNFLLERMPPHTRDRTTVLSDMRTDAGNAGGLSHKPAWQVGDEGDLEQLLAAVEAQDPEAVVIQHQDGLIRWASLGRILQDARLSERVVIVFLHIARNLEVLSYEDRQPVLAGLALADRIIVHNLSDLNLLRSFGLVSNVTLLPHGALGGGAPRPLRALPPPAAAPVIGCHGFFFRHKGIDRLIQTLPALRRKWPGLRLRLVNARYPGGSDRIISECEALADQLGVADAIDWHLDFLPVDDIKGLLSGCDLLVLPYDESDDSASGAVRVAMASLVPVLTTNVKIFEELGDAVARSQSNDPAALGLAIADLLEDIEERRAVQQRMSTWLDAHDWGAIARTVDGMIHGLVDMKRRGWS